MEGNVSDSWDVTVDLLVAGTGAAGLSAAIAGADEKLKVLVVESSDMWGGTTFLSGGGVWFPNSIIQKREGATDSYEETMRYLDTIIGDVGKASTPERRKSYVDHVDDVILTLEKYGVKWYRSPTYPDYLPHMPGGSVGRTLEVEPFNVNKLGDWYQKSRYKETIPLPLLTADFTKLARVWSSFIGFFQGVRLVFRTLGGMFTFRKMRGMGVALSSTLMYVAKKQGTDVWLSTPIVDIIRQDGEIIGAIVKKEGKEIRIRTRKGVILGTGGFAHKKEWREKYHGIPGYSSAVETDIGTGIEIGIKAGADTALLDAMWGMPCLPIMAPATKGTILIWERSMPHSIIIDQAGKRYVNESMPYEEFTYTMLKHNKTTSTIPSWIIGDHSHTKRYFAMASVIGVKVLKDAGTIVEAPTLHELAVKLGVPPENLEDTVKRFNGFARSGVDEDFHRGDNIYENYYGDPTYKNPNLGELKKGPFRATQFLPGDIGTKGGLLTDEYGRVLDENGNPIAGLYSSGNTTASVMGRTYPGAGGTIGPAMVFGFLAARHAAKRKTRS